MPYGEYAFQSTGCTGAVTMTITYPQPLPAGIQFWKYGPPTPAVGGAVAASTWFQLGGATLSFAYFDLIFALFGLVAVFDLRILPAALAPLSPFSAT